MNPLFIFIISDFDTNSQVSTMSDNSPEDSSIDPALAEAELVSMVNTYLTSPDGIRYLDDRVAPRVADLIRGDTSFFTELLTPMVKDALDSAQGQAFATDN